MPKCERWIVAQRMVAVIDADTLKKIVELGGQIGGGWCQVHQHIYVNPDNKEQIEKLLIEKGFEVVSASTIRHPEREETG
jgi:translation initiation factor 1 (eIF-1/SUI1)